MPYNRRYRARRNLRVSSYPRKGYKPRASMRRRARYRKVSSKWPIWKNPTPQKQMLCLRYLDNDFTGTTAAATYQTIYTFRGNSCFDPDQTGVGVQPYNYDQYVALGYKSYSARASAITVCFATTSAIDKLRVFVIPSATLTLAYTDPSDLQQNHLCKSVMVDSLRGMSNRNKIKHYMSFKRMYPEVPNNMDNWAATTANPAVVWYWHVIFDSSDLATGVGINFDVRIKYYTILGLEDSQNES